MMTKPEFPSWAKNVPSWVKNVMVDRIRTQLGLREAKARMAKLAAMPERSDAENYEMEWLGEEIECVRLGWRGNLGE